MSKEIWLFIIVVAMISIIGAILELRYIMKRRNNRLSEELTDSKQEDIE